MKVSQRETPSPGITNEKTVHKKNVTDIEKKLKAVKQTTSRLVQQLQEKIPCFAPTEETEKTIIRIDSIKNETNNLRRKIKESFYKHNSSKEKDLKKYDKKLNVVETKLTDAYKEFKFQQKWNEERLKHVNNQVRRERVTNADANVIDRPHPAQGMSAELFNNIIEIWTTNEGYKRINEALRKKQQPKIDANKVIGEIKRSHGETTFFKGGKQEGDALDFTARHLSLAQLKEFAKKLYNPGRPTVSHRVAVHSEGAIKQLQDAHHLGTLIAPSGLFATAGSPSSAKHFLDNHQPDSNVTFIVQGFSGCEISPKYGSLYESDERLFSSLARFKVIRFQKVGEMTLVTLRELQPNNERVEILKR